MCIVVLKGGIFCAVLIYPVVEAMDFVYAHKYGRLDAP